MALECITKESISRNIPSKRYVRLSLSLTQPPRDRVEPGNFQQHVANCAKSVHFNGVSSSHPDRHSTPIIIDCSHTVNTLG